MFLCLKTTYNEVLLKIILIILISFSHLRNLREINSILMS